MEKIKAIAIDDEKHALTALEFELKRHCPDVELLFKIQDEKEAKNILSKENIDLLFLDIHLKSQSGLQLLEELMPVDFEVIFVTAYDEYAIQAFDLSASHYLLKPVQGKKLRSAIDKVQAKRSSGIQKEDLKMLVKSLKHEISNSEKTAIPVHDGIEFINTKDIIHIKADSNYSIFNLINNRKMTVSKTLKEIENELQHSGFLRIHKSHLVNIAHLKKYVRTDGGYVIMNNGDRLYVSRNKKNLLNELFRS